MKHQYRTRAKSAVSRARALLDSGNDDQLQYAALELRLAMEALTYDRAQAYAHEIPPEQMSTWQPQKLMEVLRDIEPIVDSSCTVRIGEEPHPGGKPAEMHTLGTDTVFSLADLRKHYHAVGSALHMPTMVQMECAGALDAAKLRMRLEAVSQSLILSLNSPVWNATFAKFATLECHRCAKSIRKRMPLDQRIVEAKCFSCGAEYQLTALGDGKVLWEPHLQELACATTDCPEIFALWRDEIKVGTAWVCKQCQVGYRIDLNVFRSSS